MKVEENTNAEIGGYGISEQVINKSQEDFHIEEIKSLGYSIVEDVLTRDDCIKLKTKIIEVYKGIDAQYGKEYLAKIGEEDVVRAPLVYDKDFLDMSLSPKVYNIVKRLVGDYNILHLQNAVINVPGKTHQQRLWHRDMVYQNYVSSVPLGLSALFCIDDFTRENGCTEVLPYSHKSEAMPSKEYIKKHTAYAEAKSGSVIVFDSMLFHRSGYNIAKETRLGINNMYVTAIVKQQLSFPKMLAGKYANDPFYYQFLGYGSETPDSDREWKERRYSRINAGS